MDYKTILQMIRENAMQKLVFSLLLSLSLVWLPAGAAEGDKPADQATTYLSLGDAMVLNLTNGSRRLTFLQLKASLLIADGDAEALITPHVPAIRHQLILLLSERDAQDMKSPVKREEIRKMATARIREVVSELSGSEDVNDLLFSSFLVQ